MLAVPQVGAAAVSSKSGDRQQQHSPELQRHAHTTVTAPSFLCLAPFRCMTGENWSGIMVDAMVQVNCIKVGHAPHCLVW